LSGFTQDDLDDIAFKLNSRPRKIHGFRSPLEVYAKLLVSAQQPDSNSISSTVALGS
jgi:IS30 family transposase